MLKDLFIKTIFVITIAFIISIILQLEIYVVKKVKIREDENIFILFDTNDLVSEMKMNNEIYLQSLFAHRSVL